MGLRFIFGGIIMVSDNKEVFFFQYCETCKHKELSDTEEPCFTCLDKPVNIFSHRPTCYEEEQKNDRCTV